MSLEDLGGVERTEAQTLLNEDACATTPTSGPAKLGEEGAELPAAPVPSGRSRQIAGALALLAVAATAVGVAATRPRDSRGQVTLRALQQHQPCRQLLSLGEAEDGQGSSGPLGMVGWALGAVRMRVPGMGSQEPTTDCGPPGGRGCAEWGDNCAELGCCRDEGHQCYRKNFTYASCLPDCVPDAPSFFEQDRPAKWTCGTVGARTPGQAVAREVKNVPRWVATTCARRGFDCTESRCCAEPGEQCFERADGFGQCSPNCTAGKHRYEGRESNWTCKLLGPGPPSFKEGAARGGTRAGKEASGQCSKEGEDCGLTACCEAPGAQCYVKNSSFAECLVTCPPAPSFSRSSPADQFDYWSCALVGERTKGEAPLPPPENASLTFDDLPRWVGSRCSDESQNCASTRCCQDPEMQCYSQETDVAFCRHGCLKGMVEDGMTWGCEELGPRTPTRCPKCAKKKREPPTVVIPFFERDLCKLKYTAKSISLNDPHHFMGDVLLMWVSKRRTWDFQGQIDEVLGILRETRTATLVDFTDRMGSAGLSGWHSQQIVKLKAASMVETDYYLVLDSKNTLIHPLHEDPFFTPCGQGIIQAEFTAEDMMMPHSDWYRRSAQALGEKSPKDNGAWDQQLLWPSSITPMVLHRKSALDMLTKVGEGTDIGRLCDGSLCELIGARSTSGHGATEFTLYTLYVYGLMETDSFKCIHTIEPISAFNIGYGEDWLSELRSKILERRLGVEPSQLVVSNKDNVQLDWSAEVGGADAVPAEEEWPLHFTDVTRKWSGAIWRGEPQDAEKLVQENLQTLSMIINGSKMSPIMFGAQPASLGSMSDSQRDQAIGDIIALYDHAGLLDPQEGDIIGCVVGWVN